MRKGTEYDEEIALRAMASGQSLDWARIVCPACEDEGKFRPNMSVNMESGKAICHRCEISTWAPIDGATQYVEAAMRKINLKDVEAPEGFVLISEDPKARICRQAIEYMLSRGVRRTAIFEMGVGVIPPDYRRYWKWSGRVVFPQKVRGQTIGWVGRVCLDTSDEIAERAYMNTKGFTRDNLLNSDVLRLKSKTPCLLVEGPFDYARHFPNAVPFLGKPTDLQLAFIAKNARRPIDVGVDADAWRKGIAAAVQILKRLNHYNKELTVRVLTDKTSGLSAGTDPGETPRKVMKRLGNNARRVFSS